jgi:hypothetical protein
MFLGLSEQQFLSPLCHNTPPPTDSPKTICSQNHNSAPMPPRHFYCILTIFGTNQKTPKPLKVSSSQAKEAIRLATKIVSSEHNTMPLQAKKYTAQKHLFLDMYFAAKKKLYENSGADSPTTKL